MTSACAKPASTSPRLKGVVEAMLLDLPSWLPDSRSTATWPCSSERSMPCRDVRTSGASSFIASSGSITGTSTS